MTDLKDKTVNELLQEIVVYEQWDEKLEVHLRMEAANELARRLEEAQKQIENLKRINRSGCCCKIDFNDGDETVASVCNLHKEWKEQGDAETAAKALEEVYKLYHADPAAYLDEIVVKKIAEYRAKAKGEKP